MDSFFVEDLEKLLLKGNKHETGNAFKIFPFNTKSRYGLVSNNFESILGNYILEITQNKLKKTTKKEIEYENQNNEIYSLSSFIAADFFNNSEEKTDDEFEFSKMINSFLFSNEKFTPIHPYLFNLINFNQSTVDKEFKSYGVFLADCFGNGTKLKEIFNETSADNILTQAILNSASKLIEPNEKEPLPEYKSVLPFMTDLYKEDVTFLQQNKDRFFKDIGLLTQYYLFMYVGQFIFKAESYTEANHEVATPFHFILDNEKLSKRRKESKAIQSFEEVNRRAQYLFSHINTLSQLSYNVLQKGDMTLNERNTVLLYSQIKENFELENNEELMRDFIQKVQLWIQKYCEWQKIECEDIPSDFDKLMRFYVKKVQKGLHKDASKKVASAFKNIGDKQFIKSRGSLGNSFNLKHEVLILLTSVIVKEERMPLKLVFEELEHRGILLDAYSREEVINIYNSHNILDKKSDSGDAQYVKRIL